MSFQVNGLRHIPAYLDGEESVDFMDGADELGEDTVNETDV
jgi:hypothetical protein